MTLLSLQRELLYLKSFHIITWPSKSMTLPWKCQIKHTTIEHRPDFDFIVELRDFCCEYFSEHLQSYNVEEPNVSHVEGQYSIPDSNESWPNIGPTSGWQYRCWANVRPTYNAAWDYKDTHSRICRNTKKSFRAFLAEEAGVATGTVDTTLTSISQHLTCGGKHVGVSSHHVARTQAGTAVIWEREGSSL